MTIAGLTKRSSPTTEASAGSYRYLVSQYAHMLEGIAVEGHEITVVKELQLRDTTIPE